MLGVWVEPSVPMSSLLCENGWLERVTDNPKLLALVYDVLGGKCRKAMLRVCDNS